ncbi:lactate utilization protein [Clostridium paraputrificum]|uniref:lactate utilization protein n=1 Tax=Clostridium paraputrificum TaxID=29363 RepID=UPI00066798CC|nr:lactate utilization protein [Clostridium paraputrificum]MDB2107975.1 lactate utilization protein [Clostridium paraputrificum]MDB2114834.1 lactate utilization protein [Clostridium paraputrificum]
MDENLKWVNEQKIIRTIEALEKNNMNGYLVEDEEELIDKIKEIVSEGSMVACGGSMSLFETGVIDHLRSDRYKFLDRYKEGLTKEEVVKIYKEAFFADAYFSSSNAITEDGQLYNVDGNGNRVAALLYGPEKVIIICGVNKIVATLEDAIKRNEAVSAPANAKRLNKNTPCTKVGYCMNCNSKERICSEYTVIKRQSIKGRIHVIFLNKEIGY